MPPPVGAPFAILIIVTIRVREVEEDGTPVLYLDGWLETADIEELTRVVEHIGPAAVLDLSDLRSADKIGVQFLRSNASSGMTLRNMRPVIGLQVEAKNLQDSD